MMNQFLYGSVMMGSVCCSLFFLKFWRKTNDRFFALFSASFAMFALERWVFLFMPAQDEAHTWIFLIRLLAFALIIYAVVDKNRA